MTDEIIIWFHRLLIKCMISNGQRLVTFPWPFALNEITDFYAEIKWNKQDETRPH